MKIVFLRSNPVSPDSRVEKEVDSLLKENHDIEIIAWDRAKKHLLESHIIKLQNGNVVIHRFGIAATFGGGIKKNLLPLIEFQIKMLYWLFKNRKKYEVIHACDFDTALTAFLVSKLLRKKLIYDIFDYYIDAFRVPNVLNLKNIIKKLDQTIINNADATIICTEKRIEQIKETRPKNIEIIHNTPPDIQFSPNTKILNNNKFKIAYVGILAEGRFIEETANIVIKNKDYEFHIGGFGELESVFIDLAKRFDNIIYYGKIPYMKTLELESSCDIITAIYDPKIPNHYYAAPNKFYEALMLGKPIIMAKNTGLDYIVSENKIGEVIDYNPESLERALEKLIQRKDEWPDISLRMNYLYKKQYSWSEMERRLLSLYRKI